MSEIGYDTIKKSKYIKDIKMKDSKFTMSECCLFVGFNVCEWMNSVTTAKL